MHDNLGRRDGERAGLVADFQVVLSQIYPVSSAAAWQKFKTMQIKKHSLRSLNAS